MAKWDDFAEGIRSLLKRSRGVELDVSDDVLDAARRGTGRPEPRFDGIEVGPEPGAPAPAELGFFADPPSRFDGIEVGFPAAEPDMSLGSPLWHQMDKGMRAYDNLRRNRTPNLRNQNPQIAGIAGDGIRTREAASRAARQSDAAVSRGIREGAGEAAAAAGTVGAVLGVGSLIPSDITFGPGDAASLAEESRPVPEVATQEEGLPPDEQEFADRFKRQYLAREEKRAAQRAPEDYRFQARELINKLNAMSKQAGGEVPEAPAMTKEINRLLGLADAQRNAPGYQPAMPTDYHAEAQRLINKLNAMNSEMGGMSPETPKIMAEVRRLQALGDQMRNAR